MGFSDYLLVLTAYFIGALPSAHIIGHHYGVNMRQLGDGNLGALNVYRTLGLRPAMFVGLLDIGKGIFATWLAGSLSSSAVVPYLAALACAFGHDFSIYIRFAGGQGMAVILGSLLVLHPIETLIGFGVFLICYLLFRNWDLAWGIGMVSLIAASWYRGRAFWQIALIVVLIVTIGIKKWIDTPLAHRIHQNHS